MKGDEKISPPSSLGVGKETTDEISRGFSWRHLRASCFDCKAAR